MSCKPETKIAYFRVGFPDKDSEGNAVACVAVGVDLEVQFPGSADYVAVGSADYPNEVVPWDLAAVKDGLYLVRERPYFYLIHGNGCGSCKRYGPPSDPTPYTVKEARPGKPPAPVPLTPCTA